MTDHLLRCAHCSDTHPTVEDIIICAFQHGVFTRKKAAWLIGERRTDYGHTLSLPTKAP